MGKGGGGGGGGKSGGGGKGGGGGGCKSGGGGGKSGGGGGGGRSGSSHGSGGISGGSHASEKPGGSHGSSAMQCKPASVKGNSSHSMLGKSGSGNFNRSQVGLFSADPNSLRFTQETIKGSFSKGPMNGVKLQDAVAEVKAGSSRLASSGLQVHRGQNGELWCENNRSLYVARQAGVPSVDVKVKSNDFKSRCLGDTTKDKLTDPNFLPTIRGSGV